MRPRFSPSPLSFFLPLVDSKRGQSYRNFAAHTLDGVAKAVRQLAELLQECIDTGILADVQLFARLKLQREEWSRSYALEVELEQAHQALAPAWEKKDFHKVIEILSPLRKHLQPADLIKLEYAEKHR